MPNTAVIGFVGLGNMGGPMTTRLVRAGHTVLGVDPNPVAEKAATKNGVEIVDSVATLTRRAELVVLMLPTSNVVDDVVACMLAVPKPDRATRVVIDMGSSEPLRTRELATKLGAEGIILVDAPVSGGVVGAVEGTLTIMVGGDEATVAEVSPLLSELGSHVVPVGTAGAGHAVKALNNFLSATHLLATNEAALVAAKFGVDPTVLLAVVNTSSGRSGSSELKLPRYVLTRSFDSGFSAALLEKDIGIATRLADAVGVDPVIGAAVLDQWQSLNAELAAGSDHTEIITPLERRYGTEVTPHQG